MSELLEEQIEALRVLEKVSPGITEEVLYLKQHSMNFRTSLRTVVRDAKQAVPADVPTVNPQNSAQFHLLTSMLAAKVGKK